MLTFPHAKINIGLRIIRRRPDGYHDLQSLFLPIPLCDVLEVLPSEEGMKWDDGGFDESASEDNLVMRAYRLLSEELGGLPDVQIILRKHIPTGAGLGGGSSDASHMLKVLRTLFGLGITDESLHSIARRLGADCPFFLRQGAQIAEGIGDLLEPYDVDLRGLHLTLLFPGIHIATQQAYAGVTPSASGEDLRLSLQRPLQGWRETVVNDFEESVFTAYPLLGELKEYLYTLGADYAAMSGSGSTLYALSRRPIDLSTLPYEHKSFTL